MQSEEQRALKSVDDLPVDVADHVHRVLVTLKEATQGRYRDERLVSFGENYVHLRCREATKSRTRFVLLSIARSDSPDAISRLAAVRNALGRANDPSIGVEYASYFGGTSHDPWACLVSTFHEDSSPILEYVHNNVRSGMELTTLLHAAADQLARLHEGGFTHGDISPLNIVVTPDGVPHLVDMEYWQPLDTRKSAPLQLGGTPGYRHPDVNLATKPTEFRRTIWDLFSLGKTVLQVLDSLNPESWPLVSHYQQRALRLIACRSLDGLNTPEQVALGLNPSDLSPIAYTSVRSVCADLSKVLDPARLVAEVPELDVSNPDRVQVSPNAPFVNTPRAMSLVRLPVFQRLSEMKQLGLIELIYPTAHHSRAEHALGTYAMTCEYVRWLLRDGENPLFAQLVTSNDLKALLVAALLHDIGHYPLAHDFEEVDRSLFDHEKRTSQMLGQDRALRELLLAPEPLGWDLDPVRVASILLADHEAPLLDQVLHSIISGPIDADKMDYLVRDSSRTGTSYGKGIDVARLSTTLTCLVTPIDGKTRLVIGTKEKGVGPAETVAFARYTMFRAVYWHHSYRAIKAMIQFMVLDRMRREFNKSPKDYRRVVKGWFFVGLSGTDPLPLNIGSPSGGSQLPHSEDEVLRWIVDGGSDRAKSLYRQLSARTWMKRVLVQSLDRDIEPETSERLKLLFSKSGRTRAGDGTWMRKYILQLRLQDLIRHAVESLSDPVLVTKKRDEGDPTQRFLDLSAREQVVLLDYPDPDRTLPGDLLFAKEPDFPRSRIDAAAPLEVGRSAIFGDISTRFVSSIGKLRLLVLGDQQDFLRHALSREVLSRLVADAIAYAVSVGDPAKDEYFRLH